MEKKNCDLLFEYLRSILYDPEIKPLDLDSLDEPYHKLGLGMQFLAKSICEMMEYSEVFPKEKLSVSVPPRDNFLCKNLKNIHANLNHLTWQAKQAAKRRLFPECFLPRRIFRSIQQHDKTAP